MPGRRPSLVHTSSNFAALRVGQRYVVGAFRSVVRARVRHRLVEQQRVEVVGEVVMVCDDGSVARPAVQAAVDARLRRRRARRRTEHSETRRGADRLDAIARADVHGTISGPMSGLAPFPGERPHAAEAVAEVAVDVEVSGDVGPRQTELVRAPEQAAQCPPVAQHHHRARRGDRPGSRPTPAAPRAGRRPPAAGRWPRAAGRRDGSSRVPAQARSATTSRYPVANPASQYAR